MIIADWLLGLLLLSSLFIGSIFTLVITGYFNDTLTAEEQKEEDDYYGE